MAHTLSSLASALARWASVLCLAGAAIAQQPYNVNLLANPDFESGDASGWTATRGTLGVGRYGDPETPGLAVSALIGGGTYCVGGALAVANGCCDESWISAYQEFDLTGNATHIDMDRVSVDLGGFFGGAAGRNNRVHLRARYFSALTNGAELSVPFVTPHLAVVDRTNRHNETTMMRVQRVFPLPAGTRLLRVEMVMWSGFTGSGSFPACADNLHSKLLLDYAAMPQPLNANLIENPNFANLQVVQPTAVRPWIGQRGYFRIGRYGAPSMPGIAVGQAVQGGAYLVNADAWSNGCCDESWAWMTQEIDVTGNVADVDSNALHIRLSGYFGGGEPGTNTRSYFEVRFYNEFGGQLTRPFAPSSTRIPDRTSRNSEANLLYSEGTFHLPIGTRRVIVDLKLWSGYTGSGTTAGSIDNLQAVLLRNPPPSTPTLGANLLENGTFENGAVLTPGTPSSWWVEGATLQAAPYGLPNLPTPAVSAAIGGGGYLLRAATTSSGSAWATQTFDISGHAALVDAQQLAVDLEGWFGGSGTSNDSGSLSLRCYSAFNAQLGTQQSVGSVTAADRSNVTTLMRRNGVFTLPIGTRTIVVEAAVRTNGFVDNLRAQLVPSGLTVAHPGTGDDLELLTGVNNPPSGGPAADVKTAVHRDILTVQVRSPVGQFRWNPLMLGGNAHQTGLGYPQLGLPSLHVNPVLSSFFWLMDGTTPQGPFGPSVVIPGGTELQFVVPQGLAGYSITLQAVVLGVTANNGIYAATDAHEIRFQ
jgi:hypothetical protein